MVLVAVKMYNYLQVTCILLAGYLHVTCTFYLRPIANCVVTHSRLEVLKMKLPNGYGSVYKMKGNRRKPWVARVSVKLEYDTSKDRYIRKYRTLGYFSKRAEALEALAEFNKNPWDTIRDFTFKDVFDKWWDEQELKQNNITRFKYAWNLLAPIHSRKLRDVTPAELKSAINTAVVVKYAEDGSRIETDVPGTTKGTMKSLLNKLFVYAIELGCVESNLTEMFTIDAKPSSHNRDRAVVTDEEIVVLMQHTEEPIACGMLIMIYSGLRIGELVSLRADSVNTEEWFMVTGSKTKAGKNRTVPIHSKIQPLLKRMIETTEDGFVLPMNTTDVAKRKSRIDYMIKLFMDKKLIEMHSAHDCRHTFITKAKLAGVDEWVLKRVVGHAISDVTEGVYTHRPLEQLREEIEKIK